MTAIASIPALLSASQNSIIGLIFQTMIEQDFVPINASPFEEGDQKIGELTALEKSIFTVHSRISSQVKEKRLELDSAGEEDRAEMHKKFSTFRKDLKNLHDLFWNSIRYRLACSNLNDFEKLQLRSDGSIIAVTPDENEESNRRTLVIRIGA